MKILMLMAAVLSMTGCTSTRDAYRAAGDPVEIAYVVTEHYKVVLIEAKKLLNEPDVPGSVKQAIQDASKATTPMVLELRPLSAAYERARAAAEAAGEVDPDDTAAVKAAQAELAAATSKAVAAVASFIRAVQAARPQSSIGPELMGGVA